MKIRYNNSPLISDVMVRIQKADSLSVPGMPPTFTPKSPVRNPSGRKIEAITYRM